MEPRHRGVKTTFFLAMLGGACTRFLKANFPDRCCFKDMLGFVKNPNVANSRMKLAPWLTWQVLFLSFGGGFRLFSLICSTVIVSQV
jgi:hypothetical protein